MLECCEMCTRFLLKDNLLSSPPLSCALEEKCVLPIAVLAHRGNVARMCVRESALIACQTELASVWREPGTHCCLPSAHHPTYVAQIRINNQHCQSCFNHNSFAFRGQWEVTDIWALGWPIWSS